MRTQLLNASTLVIDAGSILSTIFWAVVIIGGLCWVIIAIVNASDNAKEIAKARGETRLEKKLLLDIFQQMGLKEIQYIGSTVDKERFNKAMEIYYQRMRELVEVKEELALLEKPISDKLAYNFFKYTELDVYLRFIVDNRIAYSSVLEDIVGKRNIKVSSGNDYEAKIRTGKTTIVVRRRGEDYSYGGDYGPYIREVEVYSGNNQVLNITLKGEMYELHGDYYFSTFKPNVWIFDIQELGEEFKALIEIEKQRRAQRNRESTYLE